MAVWGDDVGIEKHILLDATDPLTGGPRTLHIDRRDTGLRKYASCHPDGLAMIRSLTPDPGRSIVLVIAMSASEFYGPNRNGDGFSEEPVTIRLAEGPRAGCLEELIAPGEELPLHINSFLKGHNFLHHQNTDPAKAVGKVLAAFYNYEMHRPELVIDVDNSKALAFGQRIADGERPPVSMGTHVPYDVCTTCGNRAPTRASYCEHVRDLFAPRGAVNGMNVIRPDGVQHFVLNPRPRFFDISWVLKPADRTAWTIEAAAQGPKMASRPITVSSLTRELVDRDRTAKHATLAMDPWPFAVRAALQVQDQMVSATCDAHVKLGQWSEGGRSSLRTHADVFEAARGEKISSAVATMSDIAQSRDAVPGLLDIYAAVCASRSEAMRPKVASSLAWARAQILKMASEDLGVCRWLESLLPPPRTPLSPGVWDALTFSSKSASLADEEIMRNYVPESLGSLAMPDAYYGRTLDPLTAVDPRSGRAYQTTRQQAERTDLANLKTRMGEAGTVAAGTGAALGAMHLMRGKSLAASLGRIPVAIGGGLLTVGAAGNDAPRVTTLEGVDIPSNTPFVPVKTSETRSEFVLAQQWATDAQDCLDLYHLARESTRG